MPLGLVDNTHRNQNAPGYTRGCEQDLRNKANGGFSEEDRTSVSFVCMRSPNAEMTRALQLKLSNEQLRLREISGS